MDSNRTDAGFFQMFGQTIATMLGFTEYQDLFLITFGQHLRQQITFTAGIDRMRAMADRGSNGILCRYLNLGWILQEIDREFLDLFFEGSREQQGLTHFRQIGQHATDSGQEAHVQHAIGFIEYQHLDVAQLQRALFDVIDQATRCCDQNINATTQRVDLRAHAGAAVNDGRRHAQIFTVFADAVVHLHGEFACWGKNQCAWTT